MAVDLCHAEKPLSASTIRISLPADQPVQSFDDHAEKMKQPKDAAAALEEKAKTLKSLVQPKIDLSKAPDAPVNSVGIEPWAPGRGAVGIKVEVTW